MDWEKTYKELSKRNWIILLILATISYFLMSRLLTMGIILGGLIIIINFDLLQHTIRHAFPSRGGFEANKVFLIGKCYFRLLALGAIIYLLIKLGMVDPIGLIIGLSTVVFSIISFGISCALKTPNREAT